MTEIHENLHVPLKVLINCNYCLVFWKMRDLYLIIMQNVIILKSTRFHEIHPQPYKVRCFNKNSSVWGVYGGGYDPRFYEIQGHSPSPAFIKLDIFGWNTCFYKVLGGFHMKSMRFHLKSTRFHEICWISWNPADFNWKTHLQGIVTLCLLTLKRFILLLFKIYVILKNNNYFI